MRLLFLCLSVTAFLCSPCMAQGTSNEAPIEQRHDLSKLLTFNSAPVLSLEAFLLADPSAVPKEFEVFNRLRVQQINTLFNKTPLSDVLAFYQDITELNFECFIDQTSLINLRLRDVKLGQAFLAILDQVDADASLHGPVIYIHKKRQIPFRGLANAHSSSRILSHLKQVSEALSRRVLRKNGPGYSWKIEKTTLIAKQAPTVQKAIERAIAAMVAGKTKKEKPPIYQLLPALPNSPNDAKVAEYQAFLRSKTLRRTVFKGESLVNTLGYFKDISGIPTRIDPSCESLSKTPIDMRLIRVSLLNYLEVLAAKTKLSYAVTPDGIEFLKPGYEAQFYFQQRRALRAALRHNGAVALQRTIQLSGKDRTGGQGLQSIARKLGLGLRYKNQGIEKLLQVPYSGKIKKAQAKLLIADILKAHKLHFHIVFGCIAITDKVESTLPKPLSLVFSKTALTGINMGEFAIQLSKSSQSAYVFPFGLDNWAQMTIPAGSTIEQALAIAKRQSGLHVQWVADRQTRLWSLCTPDEGLFQEADFALREAQTSSIPTVQSVLKERKATLINQLKAVGSSADIDSALNKLEAALKAFTDVTLFIGASHRDNQREVTFLTKRKTSIIARLEKQSLMLKKRQESSYGTSESKAKLAKFEADMSAAKAQLDALEKAASAPNLTRPQRYDIEDKLLNEARRHDRLKRQFYDLKETMQREEKRFNKYKRMNLYGIQTTITRLRESYTEADADLEVVRLVQESKQALKAQDWSAIFPKGWRVRRDQARTEGEAKAQKELKTGN